MGTKDNVNAIMNCLYAIQEKKLVSDGQHANFHSHLARAFREHEAHHVESNFDVQPSFDPTITAFRVTTMFYVPTERLGKDDFERLGLAK